MSAVGPVPASRASARQSQCQGLRGRSRRARVQGIVLPACYRYLLSDGCGDADPQRYRRSMCAMDSCVRSLSLPSPPRVSISLLRHEGEQQRSPQRRSGRSVLIVALRYSTAQHRTAQLQQAPRQPGSGFAGNSRLHQARISSHR